MNKGFAFDPAAVAGVCSDDAANNDACPANSIQPAYPSGIETRDADAPCSAAR